MVAYTLEDKAPGQSKELLFVLFSQYFNFPGVNFVDLSGSNITWKNVE